ncbi:PRTRC system protein B [Flavobacterium supellecticarium]|uniref:PRTRC system protein B n=1 Tax=Flavobacterium supellecticarium TaxID=2565924 RepID=A0A4S4A3M4_9FLAO|nr:PRTRC system protein B [Flavobacterium supellecticarium]THF53034.1 PRTRC system protein B [Flavobacterium supellecticarium]
MKTITNDFGSLYKPVKAFVIYRIPRKTSAVYVESFDMDENGYPVNAHPLTASECGNLAKALDKSEQMNRNYLRPKGLMPSNVLHIDPDYNSRVIWHTPEMQTELFFTKNFGITEGKFFVPAMVWKASKDTLSVYAVVEENIEITTELYNAPFPNIDNSGKVCMGNVKIDIKLGHTLEDFMQNWQNYFFNSYFSHFLNSKPAKGNLIQIWQSLVNTKKKFPKKALLKNGLTLKSIIK